MSNPCFLAKKVSTSLRSEMVNITKTVKEALHQTGIQEGLCTVYSPHTTAGITINEAADPDVVHDMIKELDKRIPWNDGYHHAEGNSAAHIKTTLTGPSVSIPVHQGKMTLGTWQGIYFCEWDGPRQRTFYLQFSGV